MRTARGGGVERVEDADIELLEIFGAQGGLAVVRSSLRGTFDKSWRGDSGVPDSRVCALWSDLEVDCTGAVSLMLVWTESMLWGIFDSSLSSSIGGRGRDSCLLCTAFLGIVNGIVDVSLPFEAVLPFEAHSSGVENSTCCPKKLSMSSKISTAGVIYAISVPG